MHPHILGELFSQGEGKALSPAFTHFPLRPSLP